MSTASKQTNSRFTRIILLLFGKMRYFLLIQIISIICLVLIYSSGRFLYINSNLLVYTSYPAEYVCDSYFDKSGRMLVIDDYYENGSFGIYDSAGGSLTSFFGGDLKSKLNISDVTTSYQGNDMVLGDDGYIYLLISVWTEDLAWLKCEKIIKLSDDFEYVGTVCTIEPEDEIQRRYPTIQNLEYKDDNIYFAVLTNKKTVHYRVNTTTNIVDKSKDFTPDENGVYVGSVRACGDVFIHVLNDGSYHLVDFSGDSDEEIYRSEENSDSENFISLLNFAVINDTVYATDTTGDFIYEIKDGQLEPVFDFREHFSESFCDYMTQLEEFRLSSYQDKLYVNGEGCVYEIDASGSREIPIEFRINSSDTLISVLFEAFIILLILSTIGAVINLIIRKKNLMFKQLITIIPICVIMSLIMFYNMYTYTENMHIEQTKRELQAVTELVATSLDDFDFTGMNEMNGETGSKYQALNDKLDKIALYNASSWCGLYAFEIGRRNPYGDVASLAYHDKTQIPNFYYMAVPDDEEFAESGIGSRHVIIDTTLSNFLIGNAVDNEGISSYAEIFDQDGNVAAYLNVKTDVVEFQKNRTDLALELVRGVIIVSAIIIFVMIVLTLKLTSTIKKTTKTVSEIAKGDFSVRTQYHSDDELGEICDQVNTMAGNLEELFNEKDKTEQFYYKFVPEKFKELLGKESFTQLRLGDAESKDLTVLFCDIRSFSINSEMMTAKENFEFVNVIYGKAGPIVRKHNGFVDKYIGDAVMALFENADDAVACGIELYKEIALNDDLAKALNVSDINIGVGIHSGMARIGIVGEDERLSGTVISDTVNLSSRLESLTKQYHTAMIITKDTIDRMSNADSIHMRYLGLITAAGVNEAKAVFEVLDCLPDDLRNVRVSNTSDFREAIRLFQLGRRTDSINMLKSIIDKGENDYVVDMYYDYISSLSDEDKSNVIRFDKK